MSNYRNFSLSGYDEPKKKIVGATFEEAITLAGIGKFQVLVLLCSGLCLFSVLVESSSASYLLPSAECELDLSLKEKGLLGSSVFVGFAMSAVLWGAAGDVWGRRKTMMTTLFLGAVSTTLSSLAPSFLPLLVCRFFSGFFACAASGLLYVYAGEFYDNARRPRAIVLAASVGAGAVNLLPLLAWYVVPKPWTVTIPYLPVPVLTSWRLFLALCSIPSLFTALFLFCLPESPKFLLGKGRNAEALEVCKIIFSSNTGKPKKDYPVESIDGDEADAESGGAARRSILATCWAQTAPLFGRRLLGSTVMVLLLQAASFFGFMALIMWLPEMFNRLSARPEGTATLCDVMGPAAPPLNIDLLEEVIETAGQLYPMPGPTYNVTAASGCDPSIEDSVFLYALFLTGSGWAGNLVAGALINALGKRNLFVSMTSLSACLAATLPFVRHPVLLLVLYCSCVGLAGAGPGIIASAAIDLFPTNLRGMATCSSMMSARVGAVMSTMVFGTLLDVNCQLPFFIVSGVLICGVLIGTRLPKT